SRCKRRPAMKKNSTGKKRQGKETIGIDVGDKSSRYCVLNGDGEIVKESSVGSTKKALEQTFGALPHSRIALEAGAHSSWMSRVLSSLGHETIVANPRQ